MAAGLRAIMENAKHVQLNVGRLDEVAALVPESRATGWIEAYRNTGEHYKATLPPMPDIDLTDADVLQWSIVSSSQGFLFWERREDGSVAPLHMEVEGTAYVGGSGVEACLVRALHRDINILDPEVLASLSRSDIEEHYRDEATGKIKIQLLEKRLEHFRALGRILLDDFDGHFMNVLRRADGYLYRDDGNGFIQLLMTKFDKLFHGDWPVCKRPNVDAFGLYMKRATRAFSPDIDRVLNFRDIEKAVPGADYYRPLWFVRTGIFEISDELRERLTAKQLIEVGSDMEKEYRAFTVEACLQLADRLGGWPDSASDVVLETHAQPYLRCRRCRVGSPGGSDEGVPCTYSPVCRAYNGDHNLMECAWPLAITTAY